MPAWIQAIVARGLSVRRSARHAAMAELLAALDRDPAARRQRRWLAAAAAAAVLLVAAVVVAVWPEQGSGARCSEAGAGLAAALGQEQRAALRAAWSKDKKGAARVIAALERYGVTWAAERVAACEATHVKGEQSEQLLDKRVLCLDRRRAALAALVSALRARSAAVSPAAAMLVVARLPRIEACRDKERLDEVVPAPAGSREAIKEVTAQIERADIAFKVGDRAASRDLIKQALKRARAMGYGPLTGRAHYFAGFLAARSADHKPAREHFRQAIRLAAAAKHHRLEAVAWLGLIHYVGHITDRPEPALTMAPAAEAAVARAGNDPALRGRLDGNVGLILMSKGDYRAALERLQASLNAFVKARGPNDLDTAVARNNLALVLERLGRHQAAYAQLKQALAARVAVLGPDHYDVATALNDLGNTAHSLGKLKEARRHLERAVTIRQAVLGADHPRTGQSLNNLAIVLGDLGQHTLAAERARQAVQVAEKAHGKNHAEVAAPLNTLGNQLRELGQQRPAWEAYARGMALVEHAKGRDHIEVTPMVENLARILIKLGDLRRALEFVDSRPGHPPQGPGAGPPGDPQRRGAARLHQHRGQAPGGGGQGLRAPARAGRQGPRPCAPGGGPGRVQQGGGPGAGGRAGPGRGAVQAGPGHLRAQRSPAQRCGRRLARPGRRGQRAQGSGRGPALLRACGGRGEGREARGAGGGAPAPRRHPGAAWSARTGGGHPGSGDPGARGR